jgi:hypothetical protein
MNVFTDICLCLLPSALIWHVFAIFIFEDSRYQKHRLRKSLERIYKHFTVDGSRKSSDIRFELKLIHRNKKFTIGLTKEVVNEHYCTYTIFINGSAAGCYHQLTHGCGGHTYFFEELNHRHKTEVIDIIHAGSKKIKLINANSKEKKDGYTEYSYFN